MNKIKAIYDVVKTMKEKKEREGVLKVQVEKDGQQVWKFQNEFQNNGEGSVKCKLQTEWNVDGNEGKHESMTEFKRNMEDGCPFHGRFKHHGHFGHGHYHSHGPSHFHGHGFKHKADALLFFLRVLNELKVEEQGESLLFTLELDDEIKKIREKMQGKMESNQMFHHPHKGKLMKELMMMDKPQILINAVANKNKEVEKVNISIKGKYETDRLHETMVTVELNFTK